MLVFDQKKCLEVKQGDSRRIKEIRTSILKNFLNIVILVNLKDGKDLSGYDLTKGIQLKHGIRLSTNSVYRVVHSLEHDNLIKGKQDSSGKTVYSLTQQGREIISEILKSRREIELFMSKIFEKNFG